MKCFRTVLIAMSLLAANLASANAAAQAPGTILSQEAVGGAPDGASAYRVLYRSRSAKGADLAVSGLVIVPAGAIPE